MKGIKRDKNKKYVFLSLSIHNYFKNVDNNLNETTKKQISQFFSKTSLSIVFFGRLAKI